jgi:hypothetical protein
MFGGQRIGASFGVVLDHAGYDQPVRPFAHEHSFRLVAERDLLGG